MTDPRRKLVPVLDAPPVLAGWGIPTTLEYDSDRTQLLGTRRSTQLFFEATRRDPSMTGPLLARRGVAAVVTIRPPSAPPGEPLEILRLREHRPFEFFVARVERVLDERGWLEAVQRLGPDCATSAVIEQRAFAGELPEKPSAGRVVRLSRENARVWSEVDVDGPGPGLLAVNQSWDPGWSAAIDGVSNPVIRTDIGFSSVLVPQGRHRIELRYRDPWAERGGLLSLLALAFCATVFVSARSTPRA